jgi:hypothetical protein
MTVVPSNVFPNYFVSRRTKCPPFFPGNASCVDSDREVTPDPFAPSPYSSQSTDAAVVMSEAIPAVSPVDYYCIADSVPDEDIVSNFQLPQI